MSIADRICRTLDEGSARNLLLHEEIPDWIDIERRPPPPPRPAPKTPKEKPVSIVATKAEERQAVIELVNAAIAKIGRGAISYASRCVGLGPNTGGFHRWLKTGLGINDQKVRELEIWARDVLAAEDPAAPVRESWSETKRKMSVGRSKAWETRRQNGKAGAAVDPPAPKPAEPPSFSDDPAGTAKAKAELESPPIPRAEAKHYEYHDRDLGSREIHAAERNGLRYWHETAVRLDREVDSLKAALARAETLPAPPALGDAILREHLESICTAEIARLAPTMAERVRVDVTLGVRG